MTRGDYVPSGQESCYINRLPVHAGCGRIRVRVFVDANSCSDAVARRPGPLAHVAGSAVAFVCPGASTGPGGPTMTAIKHLWAIGFDDTTRADQVRDEILRIGRDRNELIVKDVVVVVRHPDGTLTIDRQPLDALD